MRTNAEMDCHSQGAAMAALLAALVCAIYMLVQGHRNLI